jgi:hypothetical protein
MQRNKMTAERAHAAVHAVQLAFLKKLSSKSTTSASASSSAVSTTPYGDLKKVAPFESCTSFGGLYDDLDEEN